jgi:hypothetical protein
MDGSVRAVMEFITRVLSDTYVDPCHSAVEKSAADF